MKNPSPGKSAKIITFYSYKGGTGRSMALANYACYLALQGGNTLIVDWDLEAPGLHRFFPAIAKGTSQLGVIDYFRDLKSKLETDKKLYSKIAGRDGSSALDSAVPLKKYVAPKVFKAAGTIDLICAGRFDPDFAEHVGTFPWADFYAAHPSAFRAFRELIASRYVTCLIDSRTGLTDTSGICTMVMPEKLVAVFTPNTQSLEGAVDLLQRSIAYRSASDDFRPLAIFPLPSRIENVQSLQAQWRKRYQAAFENLFADEAGERLDLTEYFNRVLLPHKSDYAFGEKIAIKEEPFSESGSLRKAYEDFFGVLTEYEVPWKAPERAEEADAGIVPPLMAETKKSEPPRQTQQPWGGVDRSKPPRFRVALSFPAGVRPLVRRIAEELAAKLGRESILYDEWYAAEFARPNLDVYLTALYIEESELIVVFLGKEDQSWVGIEHRTLRDTMRFGAEERMMLLRIDDSQISGLYSMDGSLDISTMSAAEVASAILQRLVTRVPTARESVVAGPPPAIRTSIQRLPSADPYLIGRDAELAILDAAWSNPGTHVLQIVAPGGTGKTAFLTKWYRTHLTDASIFGWSFDAQGVRDRSETSSEPFLDDFLRWLSIEVGPAGAAFQKVDLIVGRLRRERMLLILDGIETMQQSDGTVRDPALKALVQELALRNQGLLIATTRVRLSDVPDDPPAALSINLDNLSPEDGARYLVHLGVQGEPHELRAASEEYWNHALSLTHLGTYLTDFCNGDIRRRIEVSSLNADDPETHRIIAAYERTFAGQPELDVLRALGYFDRPAEPEALRLVLPKLDGRTYQGALNRLLKARLIQSADPKQPIDCHPLIREHFSNETTKEGHARLYEHYKSQSELHQLFNAVYHGCRAGRHQETLEKVYDQRILRGEFYLTRRLGAFTTNLSLLSNFFEMLWTKPVATLSPDAQFWVVTEAAFSLRAVGRLFDAVEPLQIAAEAAVKSRDWKGAAIRSNNLSSLHLTLGNVSEAIVHARQSAEFADRSGDLSSQLSGRTSLADALHQAGDLAEARRLFSEAERLQAQSEPEAPILYSLPGYRYCDLLLTQGQSAEVLRRASQTLRVAERNNWLLDIGLDHLSLGRAHSPDSSESMAQLDQAVKHLHRSGNLDYLPLALLARATADDLAESYRIAFRSGMRLHVTDYYLISARQALAAGNRNLALDHTRKAADLIAATGYHRRDAELAALQSHFPASDTERNAQ